MTLVHVEKNYLENNYLQDPDPYLGTEVLAYMGMQCNIVVDNSKTLGQQALLNIGSGKTLGQQALLNIVSSKTLGQQALLNIGSGKTLGQQALLNIGSGKTLGQQATIYIANFPSTGGQQAQFNINDYPAAKGQQATLGIAGQKTPGQQASFTVDSQKTWGQQALFHIDRTTGAGQQANLLISGTSAHGGMQYIRGNFNHLQCEGYLEADYMEEPYLAHVICAHGGMQVNFDVTEENPLGQQAQFVLSQPFHKGMQAQFVLSYPLYKGMQANVIQNRLKEIGQQAQFNIIDHKTYYGQQGQLTLNHTAFLGMQAQIVAITTLGMQVLIALYNTNRLRMLCDFPSRGLSTATGTNAWGNPAGVGKNWRSNSTAAGDFSALNLNTDIVEEAFRSASTSGINLDCDTERPQGVFLDTLGILEHNISSSATINLLGSNDPTFSSISVTIPLAARQDDPNIYYIAPTLPNSGYRYWRLSIVDPTNSDGFIQVGTIVFGAASLFVGECFVDDVEFQLKDYTDSVQTEGYTNVNNSRAQKKVLRLDFRSLAYQKSNFRLMRRMFREERTVLKCLWIPTPDPINEEYSARFAMFSKMVQIPVERHNHKGGEADYVTFTLELDESK